MQSNTGWQKAEPIPEDISLSTFLSVRKGELYLDALNLSRLVTSPERFDPALAAMTSPMEIVFLPIIRQRIQLLQDAFRQAAREVDYSGRFLYAYASKANAAEEVVRTVLKTGVDYELSSFVDVDIVFRMMDQGLIDPTTRIICNGFKQSGTHYAKKILDLQSVHGSVIPVIEDYSELPFLINANQHFDVGLRLKAYGTYQTREEQDLSDSRFGLPTDALRRAAQIIAEADNLDLVILHAMVGSQILNARDFISRLRPAIQLFVQLRQEYPTLSIFNYGGGIPVPLTLDMAFDYHLFAQLLLSEIQSACLEGGVSVPDVMGEMGRFTVAEHGAQIFKVISVKDNGSKQPWYILDGSIMSSFPDTWALTELFTVLPLTNLSSPFRPVKLGGLTCDSDDIYPPSKSDAVLWMPEKTDNLYIGFFNIGAYQEMLGGAGGSKHCVIPEANELVVDQTSGGALTFRLIPGQSAAAVLENLGY